MSSTNYRRPNVAAVVMTANEAENIGKCLKSLEGVDRVYVLDSASTDGTIEIVQGYANAEIVQMPWRGYARTFNTGVGLAQSFDWILRIDADEELVGDLRELLTQMPNEVAGIVVRRPIYFLGQPLRFGPHAKLKMLRAFRAGKGVCEETSADEHIVVEGEVRYTAEVTIVDRDLKPFNKWLYKHIRWAKKEAANVLHHRNNEIRIDKYNRMKRFLKLNLYYRLPPFFRAFAYFFYRFAFQLECLGGRSGVSWCVLQGLWYRLLVDFYIWYPELIDQD